MSLKAIHIWWRGSSHICSFYFTLKAFLILLFVLYVCSCSSKCLDTHVHVIGQVPNIIASFSPPTTWGPGIEQVFRPWDLCLLSHLAGLFCLFLKTILFNTLFNILSDKTSLYICTQACVLHCVPLYSFMLTLKQFLSKNT